LTQAGPGGNPLGGGSGSPWSGPWGGYGYGNGDRPGRGGRGGDDDDDDERRGKVMAARQVAGVAPPAAASPAPIPVTAKLIATWKAPQNATLHSKLTLARRQAQVPQGVNLTAPLNGTTAGAWNGTAVEGGCCANAVWYD
jgi:hypothetical protein